MVASSAHIDRVIEMMRAAKASNLDSPCRVGNVIELNGQVADDVVVTADLHGNRLNFEKLLQQADLQHHQRRHLVMQEVCHGGPTYPTGGCMSHLLLEDAAQMKCQFPERFHFILSNHELAELTDFAITKSGKMLNLVFREGMRQLYGERADDVRESYLEFLASCPLAVRLASGVFICHSIPEQVDIEGYDLSVFERRLELSDFERGGPVFRLVWGRDFREENASAFAELVGADVLLQGHEPCETGFQIPNSRQVILDCCSEDGCYAVLASEGKLTQQEVAGQIRRLQTTTSETLDDQRSR